MLLSYDVSTDTLFIHIADQKRSYGEEKDGITVLRDLDTDEITGYIVAGFAGMGDVEI